MSRYNKKYVSTEVSVHSMEVAFVTQYLRYEESLTEMFYFLEHLPETLKPDAQRQIAQVRAAFEGVLKAAQLAQKYEPTIPDWKRRNYSGI